MSQQDIRGTHLTPDQIEAAALDGAGLAQDRSAHLLACAECAGDVAALRRVAVALSTLPELAPTAGFADRVMARVELPASWKTRVRRTVREHRATATAAAAALVAIVGGAGIWAVRFPALRPLDLFAWTAGQASDLFWQATVTMARIAVDLGLAELLAAFGADLTLTSALAGLATIGLMGIGSLSVFVRLLRTEPPALARVAR